LKEKNAAHVLACFGGEKLRMKPCLRFPDRVELVLDHRSVNVEDVVLFCARSESSRACAKALRQPCRQEFADSAMPHFQNLLPQFFDGTANLAKLFGIGAIDTPVAPEASALVQMKDCSTNFLWLKSFVECALA
jgi:hypothetical protein